jgi:diguanylate cyclase (GGDEF)-like protein
MHPAVPRASGKSRAFLSRLRWDLSDEAAPMRDRPTIARTFIYLYGLGGTLVLATLAWEGAPDRWEPGIALAAALAYLVTGLLLVRFDRLPHHFFYALPPLGAVLVSLVVASGGDSEVAVYASIYFWVMLSAASFFSNKIALANLAWVGLCFGSVLLIAPGAHQPTQIWTLVMGTLAVLTAVIGALRGRSERLLGVLSSRSLKQERLADLGKKALAGADLSDLRRHTVETLVDALHVRSAAIFRVGSGSELLLQARAGDDAALELPTRPEQRALQDEALAAADPVMTPGSIAAAISGAEGPIGLLTAHSGDGREFGATDANFIQSVAHVIGDATERARVSDEREHRAMHDHLTGRPNRMLFTDRLAEAVIRASQSEAMVAVYFLDIDDFKLINDGFGHGAGDELLKAFGPRLREALVMTDTVARFGGDEFAILCENVAGEKHATEIAERLRTALARPFQIAGAGYRASASIGIAVTAGNESAEEVIAHADAAMYRAKERTRGGYEFFDATLRERVRMRLAFESALRDAPDDGALSLSVQPIVALPDGAPVGSEVLLRWKHPDLGNISPAEFIPIAEETGAILPLGRWVIAEAFELAARWRSDRRWRRYLPLHVNFSARQLVQPDLIAIIKEEFRRTGARRRDIAVEITEHALMGDLESTGATLTELQELGLPIVLDDFGTGYSSLSHLKQFPIDTVKIDQLFVSNMTDESKDEAIIEAVIGMADAFGLDVVAEGIETREQVERLTALGCHFGQGYLFSKPVPVAEMGPELESELVKVNTVLARRRDHAAVAGGRAHLRSV